MKYMKTLFCLTVCLLIAGSAFADVFAPTVMEIVVSKLVQYDFDGSTLEIDVNMSGVGGRFWLVINTRGQAGNINMVQNGFMGWHTVNKIDTTVYISGIEIRDTGDNSIFWDGRNNDGELVVPAPYDYYIYGYDNVNERVPACMFIQAGSGWRPHNTFVIDTDENGNPLANPIITTTAQQTGSFNDAMGDGGENGSVAKWVLGADPSDFNNLQWTNCTIYPDRANRSKPGYMFAGGTAFNPQNHDIFYHACLDVDNEQATLLKWTFVNGGNAILAEDWGGWNNITWEKPMPLGYWSEPISTVTDGDYLYIENSLHPQPNDAQPAWNHLYCYDFDGNEVFSKNMPEFYMPDDLSPQKSKNCPFLDLAPGTYRNSLFLGTEGCCMHEFIDTTALITDGDGIEADYLRWRNGQGDFFFDAYWQPDAVVQWGCLNNAEYVSHRISTVQVDANGFNIIHGTFIGNFSHGVQTQDGTSLIPGGLMAYADDNEPDSGSVYRGGGKIVDNGSAYDGMYTTRPLSAPGGGGFGYPEAWYVANASAHGIIAGEGMPIAVDESSAPAFEVNQNTPNPFNPSTTIGFTLPESGHVTVEVFNVAGQKVDTLADDYMDAGRHTAVWDASGRSNGVYFYTVRAGAFEKTMKMTLLK